MTEPENHTLVVLREMRAEIVAWRKESTERFDRIEKRLDPMHANGVKALKGFIGHRSMAERAMGSFEVDVSELKRQVAELQRRVGT